MSISRDVPVERLYTASVANIAQIGIILSRLKSEVPIFVKTPLIAFAQQKQIDRVVAAIREEEF